MASIFLRFLRRFRIEKLDFLGENTKKEERTVGLSLGAKTEHMQVIPWSQLEVYRLDHFRPLACFAVDFLSCLLLPVDRWRKKKVNTVAIDTLIKALQQDTHLGM